MWKKILLFYLRRLKGLNTPSEIIKFALKSYKNRPFLIQHGQSGKNTEFKFSDVKKRAEKIISFLFYKLKREKGDTVAFSSHNCFEYFEVRTAVHLSGCLFFALPAYLEQEDIIYFLNTTKTKTFFYRKFGNFDVDVIKETTSVVDFIDLDSPAYKEIFEKDVISRKTTYRPDVTVSLNLSSGTTKKTPKIIQLTGSNWANSLYNYILNSNTGLGKEMRLLCVLPYLTAGSTTFLPTLMAGATNIIMPEKFSPETVGQYINGFKVTHLYVTPSWFIELFEWCRQNNEYFSHLENIIIGTERMPAWRLKEAIEFFGPKISVGYGMVEVLPPITLLSAQDYYIKGKIRENVLGSVGRVLKGIVVKILDEDNKEVSYNTVGMIAVKGATVSRGYLGSGEEQIHFKNGWFYSSDYGFLDKDGFLYILGRKEEIIAREQRPYFAKELEDKLYEIPFVKRCAAVKKDKHIVLFISLREELNEKQADRVILEFCKGNVDGHLIPQDIIIKDTLPINFLGKLNRRQLISVMTAQN